jgi:hypothetical protein
MDKYKRERKKLRRERAIEKGCLNKKTYLTEQEAFHPSQTTYKCKNCGLYHRTNQVNKLISLIRRTQKVG